MSNKERCILLLDSFTDAQLANIAVMLESAKSMADDAADDAYCKQLYADYLRHSEKDDGMSLADFAKQCGVVL